MNHAVFVCIVVGLTILGILARPRGWPESVWAVSGALVLVVFRLITPGQALEGVHKGLDVYLFLLGMMLLAEVSREVGLFDVLAAIATNHAKGSAARLFTLVYVVGIVVTVFLSNDATAVVLTPAVAAAARTAKVDKPLPHLFACAFIANAASFVLPISNPANLVIFGARMPSLARWIPMFALPSLAAIATTYAVLRITQRRALAGPVATDSPRPALTAAGLTAAIGIGVTTIVLLVASSRGLSLGLPTAIAGALSAAAALLVARRSPFTTLRSLSWGVLPLVAGLFVLVEGLRAIGAVTALSTLVSRAIVHSETFAAALLGLTTAFGCNVVNNLPAGLVAGNVIASAHAPETVTRAVLIGIDLGPNLSVTGSLATILWLTALRREGHHVSGWAFFKLGALVMPPALVLALLLAR